MGIGETYDRTRTPTEGKGYNDKGANSRKGTFPGRNYRSMRFNHCAEDGEAGNGGNPEGDWDSYQYQEDRPLSQVGNAELGSSIELEWADLEVW